MIDPALKCYSMIPKKIDRSEMSINIIKHRAVSIKNNFEFDSCLTIFLPFEQLHL